MDNRVKIAALVAATAVLVAALFLIPRGDEESADSVAAQNSEASGPTGSTAESSSARPRAPKPPLLTAADPKEIEFELGELVRFSAENPTADEVHVHGYDNSMELPADRRKTMRFRADIEGIFEIELENSGQPLGTLKVVSK